MKKVYRGYLSIRREYYDEVRPDYELTFPMLQDYINELEALYKDSGLTLVIVYGGRVK